METVFVYSYVFILGCCIGSFVNVVIYRLPLGKDFIRGRSFCPSCHHTLHAGDLVPILSWILLKGRCRYCGKKISISYLLLECISGCMCVFCFYRLNVSLDFLLSFLTVELLIAISMVDFHTLTIPNGFNLLLGGCAFISFLCHPEMGLDERLNGMIIISLPLFLLTLLVRNCFGGGDIKLMMGAGFLLGWQKTLAAGLIGIMSAGIFAFYLLITRKADRKSYIAFGPFLSLGILISMFYGSEIIHGYMNLMMFI